MIAKETTKSIEKSNFTSTWARFIIVGSNFVERFLLISSLIPQVLPSFIRIGVGGLHISKFMDLMV